MRRNLLISLRFTAVTTLLFGLAYPAVVTGAAQLLFKDKANGQLIHRDGMLIGSRILGQSFSGAVYFHSRPSNAGAGYDAANSSGSNLGPSSKKLLDRISMPAPLRQTIRAQMFPLTSSRRLVLDSIPTSVRPQLLFK